MPNIVKSIRNLPVRRLSSFCILAGDIVERTMMTALLANPADPLK